jgi:hypothetical protein
LTDMQRMQPVALPPGGSVNDAAIAGPCQSVSAGEPAPESYLADELVARASRPTPA